MTVMSYYGKPVNNTDADEIRVAHEMYSNVSESTGINPGRWLRGSPGRAGRNLGDGGQPECCGTT